VNKVGKMLKDMKRKSHVTICQTVTSGYLCHTLDLTVLVHLSVFIVGRCALLIHVRRSSVRAAQLYS